MRATRTLSTLAVLAALTTVAACGSDDKTPSSTGDSTNSAGPQTEPSTDASDTSDTSTNDICTAVTDGDISGIVGHKVTREDVPGGGCNFSQEDARAVSITLNTSPYDEGTGGFDGAVSGMSALFEGKPGGALDGVGDEAFVKTGSTMGGSNTQGGGVVHVGGIVVQVTLIQGEGLSAAKVQTLLVDTLKLVATKA